MQQNNLNDSVEAAREAVLLAALDLQSVRDPLAAFETAVVDRERISKINDIIINNPVYISLRGKNQIYHPVAKPPQAYSMTTLAMVPVEFESIKAEGYRACKCCKWIEHETIMMNEINR